MGKIAPSAYSVGVQRDPEESVAGPVDLWDDKTPAPGIPLDLNFVAILILAGFALFLAVVIAHDVWKKIRRARRRRSRDVRAGNP